MPWEHIPSWTKNLTQALLQSLKARDPYTYGHCMRVARNARLLAQYAGLPSKDQKIIEFSSMFHDLGKIAIPDRILFKPGPLTKGQEAIMREHPVKSAEIIQPLTDMEFFKALIPGIIHHHERLDGCGYPSGISGEQIPINARIILIADTFDAMTTNRPYRQGGAVEKAYRELKRFSGRQFDPHLVEIFIKGHPQWGDIDKEISEEFVATHFRRAA